MQASGGIAAQAIDVPRHWARVDHAQPGCSPHEVMSRCVPQGRAAPEQNVPHHAHPCSATQLASVVFVLHSTAKPAHWLNAQPMTVPHSGSVRSVAQTVGAPTQGSAGGPESIGPRSGGPPASAGAASIPASLPPA